MDTTSSRRPLPAPAPAVRHRLPGTVAVAATAVLLGCQATHPLATRDAFFASASSAAVHAGLEAGTVIEAQQDLAAFQRACGAARAGDAIADHPDRVCDARTTRFFGRQAEAYRRWAEDRVRKLPSPGDTAAAAGD